MNRLRTILSRVLALARRGTIRREIEEEAQFHIEQRTNENIAKGMSPEEAARAARKSFGNLLSLREECCDVRGANSGEALIQDVLFGFRILRKNLRFTVIATLILAIGIGLAAAGYSVLEAFVLHPVPGPFAGELSEISQFDPLHNNDYPMDPWQIEELRSYTNLFAQVAAYRPDGLTFEAGDFLKVIACAKVNPQFFEEFGVRPILGRTFTYDEGSEGHDQVLVISYSLWQDRFGGKADIVGSKFRLESKTWTIIGVMPKGFGFPSRKTRLWLPLVFTTEQTVSGQLNGLWYCVVRQQPHVTRSAIDALLRILGKRRQKDPLPWRGSMVLQVHPINERFVTPAVQRTLWGLLGAMCILLAVICATVAGLQSVRLASRRQELAIRASLGASRWRLLRLIAMESVILVALGMCLGFVVFEASRGALLRFVPSDAPMLTPLGFEWKIFLFPAGATLFLGLAFGIFSALTGTRFSLAETLKQAGSTATAARHSRRTNSTFVIAEVALALVLVISASLLVRSALKALEMDPGFEPKQVARIYVDNLGMENQYQPGEDRQQHSERLVNFAKDLAYRLRAMPGTIAVGIEAFGANADYVAEGNPQWAQVNCGSVGVETNDSFRAIKGRLLEGRWLNESDDSPGQNTVLVNQRLAETFWPGQSAIGKRLILKAAGFTNPPSYVVVGIVKNIRDWSFTAEMKPAMYETLSRSHFGPSIFAVRTRLDHASFVAAVRDSLKQVLPGTMEPEIHWLAQGLYASTAGQRLYATSLSGLATLALCLASLGIYGVLSYMVAERRREIAIRMALGASRSHVKELIVRQGAWLIGCGTVFGLVFSAWATRALRSQVFGIGSYDPPAWAVACLVLLTAGILASYLPARRAANLDLLSALRYE